MFKNYSDKSPLERALDHISKITKASTLNSNNPNSSHTFGGTSPDSSPHSSPVTGEVDHKLCQTKAYDKQYDAGRNFLLKEIHDANEALTSAKREHAGGSREVREKAERSIELHKRLDSYDESYAPPGESCQRSSSTIPATSDTQKHSKKSSPTTSAGDDMPFLLGVLLAIICAIIWAINSVCNWYGNSSESNQWFQTHNCNSYQPLDQYKLGISYRNGAGVKRDMGQAAKWLTKAAEQGHVEAMNALGELYMTDGSISTPKAEKWFRAASDKGHINAKLGLADVYLRGCSTKNPGKAMRLYIDLYIIAQQTKDNELFEKARDGILYVERTEGGVWPWASQWGPRP